jgi:outer membrane protein OmpA-like peptidoglycan-associated protein
MTEPGPAHPPGGALRHPPSSARLVLAGGLLALGLGDLAVINLVLLPRFTAARQEREHLLVRARLVAALAPSWLPVPSPAVAPPGTPEPPAIPPPAVVPTVAVAPTPTEPAPAAAAPPRTAPNPPPPPAPAHAAPARRPPPPPRRVTPPPPSPVGGGADPPAEPPAAPPPAATAEPAQPATEPFPDLLFAINASWLSRASRETLDRVVEVLGQDPGRKVVLSGHTDTSGAVDINRALSWTRARRAARYLQAHGVAADRIETHSFGSARPAVGEVPRARLRRVEIAVQ